MRKADIYDIETCIEIDSRRIAQIIKDTEETLKSRDSERSKDSLRASAYEQIVDLIFDGDM